MPTPGAEPAPDGEAFDPALEREATEWFFRRDGRALAQIEATWRTLASARDRVVPPVTEPAFSHSAKSHRSWRNRRLAAAAGLALALGGWVWLRPPPGEAASLRTDLVFATQAATPAEGLRRMDLPDGSSLTLNAASAVEVRFTHRERRIRLQRGEAHFAVAKHPGRPFVVEANGVAVKAVGTAFYVRLHAAAVEVIVTEGKVRVDDAAHGASLLSGSAAPVAAVTANRPGEGVLSPGEKVVISVRTDAPPAPAIAAGISAQEVAAALAWRQRWLDYSDAPLATIIADFNRFNQHRLVIADARLAHRRFGGTFPAGDYQSLVQVLERTFGVQVERREHETILRLP
jgi:transmembrane sensor